MKATSKTGNQIDLGNLKSSEAYQNLNEDNFEKIQEGNVLTNEGYFFQDFKVGNTILRKIHPTWLASGRIENLGVEEIV